MIEVADLAIIKNLIDFQVMEEINEKIKGFESVARIRYEHCYGYFGSRYDCL